MNRQLPRLAPNPGLHALNNERPTVFLSICDSRAKTTLDNFNVGNRLFVHACARHLRFDMEINDLSIRPRIETLLLPFPNFIRENDDLKWLEDYILATDAQSVVLLCGGVQSYERKKLNLPAGAIRTLQLISSRSALLGVRGQFTAEVLNDCGIRNVAIIGCPSLHWWMDPNFTTGIPGPNRDGAGVVHATPDGNFAAELAELYAFGTANDLAYVLQTEFHFATPLGAAALPDAQGHLDWAMANYRASDLSADTFLDWIARRAFHFSDVPEWIEFMRGRRYAIGNRLHGSIAAILAGKPARILWHDERVREVADVLGIPAEPFRGQVRPSIEELIPNAADMDVLNRRYKGLLGDYISFLLQNGLELSAGLAKCA